MNFHYKELENNANQAVAACLIDYESFDSLDNICFVTNDQKNYFMFDKEAMKSFSKKRANVNPGNNVQSSNLEILSFNDLKPEVKKALFKHFCKGGVDDQFLQESSEYRKYKLQYIKKPKEKRIIRNAEKIFLQEQSNNNYSACCSLPWC
ncbi:MAG: hypothetical protein EP298_01565 [Gammaproteobacteria bacterium]|nr:MAG: hypothetical protein EP298_01565 [Gammaproteobacteria bacterium]UTW43893.1 hypothetical protein KFE69_07335 [bacterium SCSIO 12844]